MRRRHVVQERVRGPDDRAGAHGARVDDGQVVVGLQVVAADVLSIQVGRSNLTSQDTNFFDLICQLLLTAYGILIEMCSIKDIPVLLLVPAECAHEAATSGVNQLLSQVSGIRQEWLA